MAQGWWCRELTPPAGYAQVPTAQFAGLSGRFGFRTISRPESGPRGCTARLLKGCLGWRADDHGHDDTGADWSEEVVFVLQDVLIRKRTRVE